MNELEMLARKLTPESEAPASTSPFRTAKVTAVSGTNATVTYENGSTTAVIPASVASVATNSVVLLADVNGTKVIIARF